MALIDGFLLKLKRGDTPFYRGLRGFAKGVMRSTLPVPKFIFPFLRFLYHLHFAVKFGVRWLVNYFYCEPLFRSRCVSIGKRFHLWLMPDITGHPKIVIGDDVNFFGLVAVASGRVNDEPRLIIGNRVDIGHNVAFMINQEVVIEDDVNMASNCRIADNDAHPRDLEARIRDLPPGPEEIKPVRICRGAWIGHGCYVMKGVTIGEGAIIGSNSVVVTDIPPFTIAMGNPARVVVRNQPAASKGGAPSVDVRA